MRRFIFGFLIIIGCIGSSWAATNRFEQLGVSDGLSHYSINAFYQDETGRMWVATKDGLNCVTGAGCRVFRRDKDAPLRFPSNYIRRVVGDADGHMLLQSSSSAMLMNLHTEQLQLIDSSAVQVIAYGKHRFLFAARDSIFQFSPDNKPLFLFSVRQPTAILETEQAVFVASKDSVFLFPHSKRTRHAYSFPNVSTLFEDSKHNVWMCSRSDGLLCLNTNGAQERWLNHADVRCITEDHAGNYWIGTWSGLFQLDGSLQQLHFFRNTQQKKDNPFSIWALTCDKQGTIWIGSYFGAISLYNPSYDIFDYWGTEANDGVALSYPIIGRTIKDSEGNLWIGTNGGGVDCISPTNEIRHFHLEQTKPECAVKAFLLDEKRHALWIGTHQGGLKRLDMRTAELTTFTAEQGCLPNNRVRELIEKGDTIIFSTEKGLGMLDRATMTFQSLPLPIIGELADLFLTGDTVWCARQRMTYAYILSSEQILKFPTSSAVHVFARDYNGNLIAGTSEDGVIRFSAAEQAWTPFRELNDLLKHSAIIDLNTTKSNYLVAYHTGIDVIARNLSEVKSLTTEDGFPLGMLMEQSVYADNTGQIYVGGIDGLCSFQEKDIESVSEPSQIFPVQIAVRQKDGYTRYYEKALPFLSELVMSPNDMAISVRFGTSNFCKILRHPLYVQLVGFDSEWMPAGDNGMATYTNLPHGNYVLRVKDTVGNTYRIDILVKPHWWETWAAKIAFFLLLICVIVGGASVLIMRIKNNARKRLAEKDRLLDEKNQQIQQMKEKMHNEQTQFVAHANAVILANLADPDFDINSLARELCLSRTGLYNKLQEAAGKTPNDFITYVRLNHAARLLKEHADMPVVEISELVGYNSSSYFIRCFRGQFGMTPNEYRKTKVGAQ